MRGKRDPGLVAVAAPAVLVAIAAWSIALPLASAAFWSRNEITPPLKIAQGELTGLVETSVAGNKFLGFYGIPFAKPPVGDLRFQAPEPAGPWEGVRTAHKEGHMCPQVVRSMRPQASVKSASDALKVVASLPGAARLASRVLLSMSEDCLHLNVYTPVEKLPVERLMPVLFFIHGGGYQSGSGDTTLYGPELLMDQGVVLVTTNYRLGPFGFLAANSSDAPGNAGLKDQLLALKWVKDNIRDFGGDPSRVTLYGASAGAQSVHLHVLAPPSKGLFHAAILSSGAVPHTRFLQTDADGNSRRLAEAMGAGADTAADVRRRIQFLRDAPWKDIVTSVKAIAEEKNERALFDLSPWRPVVEAGGAGAFLERSPNDILVSGDFDTEVPLMIGLNDKEGSVVYAALGDDDMTRLQANPTLLLAPALFEMMDANGREELSGKIRETYFKDQPIDKEIMDDIADVFGDEFIAHDMHVATHWHLKHAKVPVFLYYFVLDAFGIASFISGTTRLKGAGHGDDLGYVFKNHLISDAGTADRERVERGTARMTSLIANFVRQRNPTPAQTELLDALWAPSTADKQTYMEIGDNLTLRAGPILKERMQFWDDAVKAVIPDPVFDI